jgi:hypothetical protein
VASLRSAPSIGPRATVSLPVIGGSRATQADLGPGHPHVLVFLASWLSEISDVPHQLRALERYQREADHHGWPTVVAIDERPAETSSRALISLIARAGPLSYPVAADATGRLADGHGVQELPWIELTSPGGQIRYTHDGWLTAAALARTAARVTAQPSS